MKIGLSLDAEFLTGRPVKAGETLLLSEYGSVDRFLEELAGIGVTHVEIHNLYPWTEPDLATNAAEAVWSSGLALSVHGALNRSAAQGPFVSFYPSLKELLHRLSAHQESLVLTVHACSGYPGNEGELGAKTQELLKEWIIAIKECGLPMLPALELNRRKNTMDPSSSCEGVIGIIGALPPGSCGICWDMGHYYSNRLNGFADVLPPEAFVMKTIHTHIHGVVGGKTHGPVTAPDSLPLEAYIGALTAAGYNGIYNLEFNPEFTLESVRPGIDRLKKIKSLSA